jgi:hypothetical protein
VMRPDDDKGPKPSLEELPLTPLERILANELVRAGVPYEMTWAITKLSGPLHDLKSEGELRF